MDSNAVDLHKTCATYYNEHVPESSVEILGHAPGGRLGVLMGDAITAAAPRKRTFTGFARSLSSHSTLIRANLPTARMSDDLEELKREILDRMPQMVFVKDANQRFIYVNQQMASYFGSSLDQLLGKTDADLIQPEAIETYLEDDRRVIAAGEPVIQQEMSYTPSGERALVQVTKWPWRGPDGSVKGIIGVAVDISHLTQDYESIKQQLEEKDALLRNANEQLKAYSTAASAEPARPKVFVSYKHSDDDHISWVSQFARDLIEIHEIDCILDQFDLDYGDSIQHFMQKIQTDATHFLMIITPQSVAAIENNAGGIAFESQLAATRRAEGRLRLIPVLRSGDQSPAYVRSHRYIDFRNDAVYRDMLKRLADTIVGLTMRPKLGARKHEQ